MVLGSTGRWPVGFGGSPQRTLVCTTLSFDLHAHFVLQVQHGDQTDRCIPKVSGRLRRVRRRAAWCKHARRNAGRSARKLDGSGRNGFASQPGISELLTRWDAFVVAAMFSSGGLAIIHRDACMFSITMV